MEPEDLTNEQILKEAWQGYNGIDKEGYGYWKPELDDDNTVILVKSTSNPHSDRCWENYKTFGGN